MAIASFFVSIRLILFAIRHNVFAVDIRAPPKGPLYNDGNLLLHSIETNTTSLWFMLISDDSSLNFKGVLIPITHIGCIPYSRKQFYKRAKLSMQIHSDRQNFVQFEIVGGSFRLWIDVPPSHSTY